MFPLGTVDIALLLGPSIALITAGGILSFSIFISPLVRQTAAATDSGSTALALAQLRSTFHTGSHLFPQLATLSAALLAFLAKCDAQAGSARRRGFALAAVSALSILPFTIAIMYPPVNKRLIELDEHAKSSAAGATEVDSSQRTAEVLDLLVQFERLNVIRACLLGASGLLGLWTSLRT